MESSLKNTPALLNHIDRLTSKVVTNFLNIVDLARIPTIDVETDGGKTSHVADRNQAAANTFRMEVETAALIRAAEDILTLIRQMKELWLFGQLNTLEDNKVQEKTEEDAKAVGEMLERLLAQRWSEPAQA